MFTFLRMQNKLLGRVWRIQLDDCHYFLTNLGLFSYKKGSPHVQNEILAANLFSFYLD
jgi:hypothetical protein